MQKVLICSRVSLFPPEHGGAKNFRYLVRALRQARVQCRVLVQWASAERASERFSGQSFAKLADAGIKVEQDRKGIHRWHDDGTLYLAQEYGLQGLANLLTDQLAEFCPDRVVLSDDTLDSAEELFVTAAASGKLVFSAQTIHGLPFGPYSLVRNEATTQALCSALHIVTPSRSVQEYVRAFLGKMSSVYYPPVFGPGPFPNLGNIRNEFVTMINPCPWKGGSIFLALARALPSVAFAAVPTWGATPAILDDLRALPNVRILPESPNIDDIFALTKVLLVPSLCQEAFGLVAPEALLRGIPVLASDLGGLRESTLGAAQLLQVRALEIRQGEDSGAREIPWREPENDLQPWIQALRRLVEDPVYYSKKSAAGRKAALDFVTSLQGESPLSILKLA